MLNVHRDTLIKFIRIGEKGVRAQELCESRGGRPGFPVPSKPTVSVDDGKATLSQMVRLGEGREIIYLSLHCLYQNDPCIKVGSDENRFNV